MEKNGKSTISRVDSTYSNGRFRAALLESGSLCLLVVVARCCRLLLPVRGNSSSQSSGMGRPDRLQSSVPLLKSIELDNYDSLPDIPQERCASFSRQDRGEKWLPKPEALDSCSVHGSM